VKIGDLRHRIELQAPTDYTDEFGQPVRTWKTYNTIWAQVSASGIGEGISGAQLSASESYAILCRYNAAIKTNHRILFGEKVLNIVGPPRDLDGTRVALLIGAMENVAAEVGGP
jgi:SPP1 family predicted phage head-tail adaptor